VERLQRTTRHDSICISPVGSDCNIGNGPLDYLRVREDGAAQILVAV
jgi:hypothetical protein